MDEILKILEKVYRDDGCGLNFRTPFQLLVSTMLSAQSTDKTVNRVTEKLFAKYPGVYDLVSLGQGELEQEIKEIGIYRNKAKNILTTCHILIERYGGEVPDNMEDLTTLPGVGRKTANVVLSNAFGIPAMAVDTHVFRVSNRLGLAKADNVLDTEMQLMENIPKELWIATHHRLIWHGRRVCMARNPDCIGCPLNHVCQNPVNI